MDALRVISRDELTPVLDALSSATWPMQSTALIQFANTLGWKSLGARRKGFSFETGLGFNFDFVNALAPKGSVTQITIGVTDSTRGVVHGSRDLPEAFTDIANCVATELGHEGVAVRKNRRVWDLDSEARIAIEALDDQVLLELLAPEYAQIERREVAQS